MEKVRLSLELSQDLNATLEELAKKNSVTKSELLRRAIALMEVAAEGKAFGQVFGLVDQEGRLVTRIVGV